MSDTFCQVCKCFTEVVSDQATGDASCSECGTLVLDDTSELGLDPTRESPVRPESGASGSNGATEEEEEEGQRRKRRRRPKSPAYESIAEVAERLGLVATIKDRASDIYKKVIDEKPLKYKTPAAVVAACIYVACRQESAPRTMKEMCSANGVKQKEVVRVKDFIMRYLVTEGQEIGTVHAADFVRHFCSALGMSNTEIMAAQETVRNSEELAIRRSPISVAAVVIYIIAQLSDDKKAIRGYNAVNLSIILLHKALTDSFLNADALTALFGFADVALATRVAEATIRSSYRDLYPHLSEVIPTWFAKEKDLKKLPP